RSHIRRAKGRTSPYQESARALSFFADVDARSSSKKRSSPAAKAPSSRSEEELAATIAARRLRASGRPARDVRCSAGKHSPTPAWSHGLEATSLVALVLFAGHGRRGRGPLGGVF